MVLDLFNRPYHVSSIFQTRTFITPFPPHVFRSLSPSLLVRTPLPVFVFLFSFCKYSSSIVLHFMRVRLVAAVMTGPDPLPSPVFSSIQSANGCHRLCFLRLPWLPFFHEVTATRFHNLARSHLPRCPVFGSWETSFAGELHSQSSLPVPRSPIRQSQLSGDRVGIKEASHLSTLLSLVCCQIVKIS